MLRNVDEFYGERPMREQLRLIALIHDTFKYQVDLDRPRAGENHHAMLARRFAERYISNEAVLDVIELHDEAYNAWQKGNREGKWGRARERAAALVGRLGDNLLLYLAFYHCDNATAGKDQHCLQWFREFCEGGTGVDESFAADDD